MARVGSEAGRYGGFQNHGHSGIADIIQPLSITTAAISDAYGSITFTFPSIPVSQDWIFSCNVADAPSTAVFLAESVPTNLGSWTAGNNAGPFKAGANETLVVKGFALLPNLTYQCTITGEAVTSGKSSNVFPYPSTSTVITQNQAGLSTISLQILQKTNAGNIGYSATSVASTSIAVSNLDSATAGTSVSGFTITVTNVFALGSRGLYLCWNGATQYQIYNPTTGSISAVYTLPITSNLTISPDGFWAINWQSTQFYLVNLTTFTSAALTIAQTGSGSVNALFDSTSKYTICICVSSPNFWINVNPITDVTSSTLVFGNTLSQSQTYTYSWLATSNAVYLMSKASPASTLIYYEKFTWTNINVSWTNVLGGSLTAPTATNSPSTNYNTWIYNSTVNKTYQMISSGLYYWNGLPEGTPTLVPTTTSISTSASIAFDKTNTYLYSLGATNVLWRTTVATQTAVNIGTYTWPSYNGWAYNFIQQQPFVTLPTGYAYRIATITVYNSTATTGNVALSTNAAFTSGIFAVIPVNTKVVLNGRMIPSSIYATNNIATGTTYLEIGYDLVFYDLTQV